MTSIAAHLSVSASWQTLSPASVSNQPNSAPTLTRDRAFTSFASAILGALGASGSPTSPGASADATGGRVGDVALALKNALESPSAAGDVVGSLIRTVQSALATASQSLSDAGYSSDAIRSFATAFSTALSDRLDTLANQAAAAPPSAPVAASVAAVTAPTAASASVPVAPGAPATVATPVPTSVPAAATPVAAPASAASTSPAPATPAPASTAGGAAFEADFRQTDSGAIELLTTQGDLVRISFRNSTGGSVVGATASGAAGLAAYAAVGSYASSRFSVSVQGSLNSDEVKAINDVLGQVNTLATQFFSGNLTQAFASAASLGVDPTEIAGVALHLSESTSLRLTSVGDGNAAPASDAAAAAAPAAADPATVTPVAAPATTTPVTVNADPTTATTAPAAAPPLASSATGGGISSLLDYLQQVLDTLGSATTSGTVTFSAKAKIALLASAVGAASITPQESTAAGLLKNIAAATTDASTPAAAPAASTTQTPSA